MTNEKLVELLREARRLIHTALSIDALQHWACESDDDEVALDDEMRALRTNIDAALAEADDDGESAHRKFMTALAAMNKDQQRQTLVNAGILTEGGAVAEPYKDVLAEQQGPTKEVVASDEVTWAWVSPSEYRASLVPLRSACGNSTTRNSGRGKCVTAQNHTSAARLRPRPRQRKPPSRRRRGCDDAE